MAESTPRFEPIAAVVCDEIREEISQKEIFIGVYSTHIVVHRFPLLLPLQVHIIGKFVGRGKLSFEMRISHVGQDGGVSARATLDVPEPTGEHEHLGLSLPRLPVQIAAPGTLFISFRQGEEGWRVLKTLPVLDPAAAAKFASAPAQPS